MCPENILYWMVKRINSKISSRENFYVGEKIGELTVLRKSKNVLIQFHGRIETLWFCRCSCGQLMVVPTSLFSYKKQCNCGHVKKEVQKHCSKWRLYRVWCNMKARCENPSRKDYRYYGGRGIKMCDEWSKNYSSFNEWVYNNGYDPDAPFGKCTIDRIDVNGDYCPENCRWVDMSVQSSNKRPRKSKGSYIKEKEVLEK